MFSANFFAGRTESMEQVFLSLGSNLGDRLANLRQAVASLRHLASITALSDAYETEPVGLAEQPWFLNAVVALQFMEMDHARRRLCKTETLPIACSRLFSPSSAPWDASATLPASSPKGRASSIWISSCMAAA